MQPIISELHLNVHCQIFLKSPATHPPYKILTKSIYGGIPPVRNSKRWNDFLIDLLFNIFVNAENKHPHTRYMVWERGPKIQGSAKI